MDLHNRKFNLRLIQQRGMPIDCIRNDFADSLLRVRRGSEDDVDCLCELSGVPEFPISPCYENGHLQIPNDADR